MSIEESKIIEARIYWNDDPDNILDVLFGVVDSEKFDKYDHEIFYYLDYPEEIENFTRAGLSDFTVVSYNKPKSINEIFL